MWRRIAQLSLEIGRVGYVEAWGGDEFGYSYTYTLAGQPRFEVIVANQRAQATELHR